MWNPSHHSQMSNNWHCARKDGGGAMWAIIVTCAVFLGLGFISFILGLIEVLFYIVLFALPIGLFIFGCIWLYEATDGNKFITGVGVVIMLFCMGGVYHYMLEPHGSAPQHTNRNVNDIDNTLDDLLNRVSPNHNNNDSVDFVNGQSNKSGQQQVNLVTNQSQPTIKDEGKFTGMGTLGMHVKTKGNQAVAHYKVYYSYDNSNNNSSLETETVGKRYAWVAHLQKINGKWLIKTNTSNNKVISHS